MFGVQLWDLTRSTEFNRILLKAIFQYASLLWNMSTDRYWQSTGRMYLMCATVSDLTVLLWLGKSCLIPRSLFHLISFPQKKKSTHTFPSYIYRILFHYVAMTSRYIDTQLLLCVYVHLWVYVCVKRAVRPQKQNENPVWGSPQWVNKAEIASERALGDSLCRHTHTHTQTS